MLASSTYFCICPEVFSRFIVLSIWALRAAEFFRMATATPGLFSDESSIFTFSAITNSGLAAIAIWQTIRVVTIPSICLDLRDRNNVFMLSIFVNLPSGIG